jgi:hypothetical protein
VNTLAPPTPAATGTARRWLLTVGALLLAGPILFDLGYALHPSLPMDVEGAIAEVADVRTLHAAAKVMVAFGGLLLIALLLTYRRWLVPGRGRAFATVGTALAAIGLAANSLSQATHGYLLYWASSPDVARSAGADVVAAAETDTSPVTLPVSFWSVPLFALGLVLVAVALWRAGSVPRWVPVGMVVGGLAAGAVGTGPLMLVVLVLDIAVAGTALAHAARRAADVAP